MAELQRIVDERDSVALNNVMSKMQMYNGQVLGSGAYFFRNRKQLEALMQAEGMPTLWFTFTAADNHWFDLHAFGDNMGEGLTEKQKLKKRASGIIVSGAQNVCHCQMHSFTDRICGRILASGSAIMDSPSSEFRLESFANEFASLIVNTFVWSQIPQQPQHFKHACYVCCSFILNKSKFSEICHGINTSQRVEFKFSTVDFNFPWTNQLDRNGEPWNQIRRSFRRIEPVFLNISISATGELTSKDFVSRINRNL
ncbi:unnamed protein product [Cylindrotheca closterium]|uniref:Helitron helicase-like domain-containing protein n=1 Tax=Cylindrotheca closterium TaxID=2856 RepID=A0AAD2CVI8_9STRA|nr:unnamed protein product [Cylindrotheca closterium]